MRPLATFALLMVLAFTQGCVTATAATAGTMVGLAASAVSTGSDVYRLGKLDSADLATREVWIASIRQSADDLSLVIDIEADTDKGNWRCTLADARSTRFRVYVEPRTKTLMHTRIDMGIFGSEPTARLFLARVREHAVPTTAPASKPATRSDSR